MSYGPGEASLAFLRNCECLVTASSHFDLHEIIAVLLPVKLVGAEFEAVDEFADLDSAEILDKIKFRHPKCAILDIDL